MNLKAIGGGPASKGNMFDPIIVEYKTNPNLMFVSLAHELIHLNNQKQFHGDPKKAHIHFNKVLKKIFSEKIGFESEVKLFIEFIEIYYKI